MINLIHIILQSTLLISFLSLVSPYRRGDVVSTLVRSQHNGWRTPWTEVARSEMPRFREESIVSLKPPLHPESNFDTSESFKLSLSYSDSIFVVPWVATLSPDESGMMSSLNYLKISFFFSGSDILQVKWNGKYKNKKEESNFNLTSIPEVKIHHEWIEVVEHDIEAGLIMMFGVTLLAVLASLLLLCSRESSSNQTNDTQKSKTAKHLRERRRYQ